MIQIKLTPIKLLKPTATSHILRDLDSISKYRRLPGYFGKFNLTLLREKVWVKFYFPSVMAGADYHQLWFLEPMCQNRLNFVINDISARFLRINNERFVNWSVTLKRENQRKIETRTNGAGKTFSWISNEGMKNHN